MRIQATHLGTFALVMLLVLVGTLAGMSAQRQSPPLAQRESLAEERTAELAEQLFAKWAADYEERSLYTKTPIPLGFSRAFSKQFTKARGKVEINFQTAQVTVSVNGLDPLSQGSTYEVWLVQNGPGPRSAAIEEGKDGDRILNLGTLPPVASFVTSVDALVLANFEADEAVVMRLSPNRRPEYVIGGRQSIRFKIGREATIAQQKSAGNMAAAGFGRTRSTGPLLAAISVDALLLRNTLPLTLGQGGNSPKVRALNRGRDLFFNNTFGGNGRTCATCHPANNELTIDHLFIADLALTNPLDPLFVAEFNNPLLPDFDPNFPHKPAIEFSALMSDRGLILENINGFEVDASGDFVEAPFFRTVPSLFNLEFTAPFGLSGDIPDLQTFAAGAVVQHFTRSTNRTAGKDFVFPTAAQLSDMEAFMLSNRSPASGNFKISGRKSLLSTNADPAASDTNRPEVKGRNLFTSVGCTSCHTGTVGSGGNFNTGVESLEPFLADPTPTMDTGDGFKRFNAPQVFGLRKKQFFHTGVRGNNPDQITNLRDAVSFYTSGAFALSPEGPTFPQIQALRPVDVSDIAAFLQAISVK